MPATYSQLYAHVIFGTKGKTNLIQNKWEDDLYKYITGIIKNKKNKLFIIGGMPDHIHLLIGAKPDTIISNLVRDIKTNSSRWINENGLTHGKFEWQEGFGAFSVSSSQVKKAIKYIMNQKEHHRKKTFRDEFIDFLKAYEIEYKAEYLLPDFKSEEEVQEIINN